MASKSTSSNSPSPLRSHSQRQLALSDPGCAIRPMIDPKPAMSALVAFAKPAISALVAISFSRLARTSLVAKRSTSGMAPAAALAFSLEAPASISAS